MAKRRTLKKGFTTGTAAAAAAKGALLLLLKKKAPTHVRIAFLSQGHVDIALKTCVYRHNHDAAVCTVIKDAGDDPDITHGAEIGAIVSCSEPQMTQSESAKTILITGGTGVGVVSKLGLDVAPGNAAINPGPMKMIRQAVEDVLNETAADVSVNVEVFVPRGEVLARKTLNARLGILGGISILGTTGIVNPLSHDAWKSTIVSAVSVAKASGINSVVFTTGRRSERFAQKLFPALSAEAFIQSGDFFQFAMQTAADYNLRKVILAVFFGKALKMAYGVKHTHASKSELSLNRLAEWTFDITGDKPLAEHVRSANTARHAFEMLATSHRNVIEMVGNKMILSAKQFSKHCLEVTGVIFDYTGEIVFHSNSVEQR